MSTGFSRSHNNNKKKEKREVEEIGGVVVGAKEIAGSAAAVAIAERANL